MKCFISPGHVTDVSPKFSCTVPCRIYTVDAQTQREINTVNQPYRNVVASHTVQAINMERILNSIEHQTVEAAEIEEEKRKDEERKSAVDQRQLLTRFW